eukprot:440861-Pelagomonas_calceolata.AAC.1
MKLTLERTQTQLVLKICFWDQQNDCKLTEDDDCHGFNLIIYVSQVVHPALVYLTQPSQKHFQVDHFSDALQIAGSTFGICIHTGPFVWGQWLWVFGGVLASCHMTHVRASWGTMGAS